MQSLILKRPPANKIEEVLGRNPRIFQSGKHSLNFYIDLWDQIKAGKIWNGIFINKRKDGSEYHEAATIFPIKDKDGLIINFAAVKRDISIQVQAEEEINLFTKQLTALHEISILLSLQGTYDDVCQQAVLLGHEQLGFDRLSLWFIDHQNPDYLNGTFSIDEDGQIRDKRHQRMPIDSSPIHGILLSGQPRVHHQENVMLLDENEEEIGSGDAAAAGLWDGNEIIGYIRAEILTTGVPYTTRDLELLNLFAQIISNLHAPGLKPGNKFKKTPGNRNF